jgi:flagellar motor protein MotB
MKLAYGTALLCFLLGASVQAAPQEPEKEKPAQQDEHKKPQEQPKKQEEPKKQVPDEHRQQQQQQQEHQAAKQQEERQHQDARQQQEQQKQQEKQNREVQKQEQRQERERQDARRDQRGAEKRNVRVIPEDRFRQHFGHEHHFHVEHRGDRRFSYGGYWFTFAEPVAPDWIYSDDCYIDYIDDEYYLVDFFHPELRIVVIVVE